MILHVYAYTCLNKNQCCSILKRSFKVVACSFFNNATGLLIFTTILLHSAALSSFGFASLHFPGTAADLLLDKLTRVNIYFFRSWSSDCGVWTSPQSRWKSVRLFFFYHRLWKKFGSETVHHLPGRDLNLRSIAGSLLESDSYLFRLQESVGGDELKKNPQDLLTLQPRM